MLKRYSFCDGGCVDNGVEGVASGIVDGPEFVGLAGSSEDEFVVVVDVKGGFVEGGSATCIAELAD